MGEYLPAETEHLYRDTQFLDILSCTRKASYKSYTSYSMWTSGFDDLTIKPNWISFISENLSQKIIYDNMPI